MRNTRNALAIILFSLMPNLTAQIDMEEMQRRTATDLYCGPIAEDGRVRMRQKRWLAHDEYNRDITACKGDKSCLQRAQARAVQRDRMLQMEQAQIDRVVEQCAAAIRRPSETPESTKRPSRGPVTQSRPVEPQQKPTPSTPDGDWRPPDRCQGMVENSRDSLRRIKSQEQETYRLERTRCGGSLECLERAKENAAERSRQIRIAEAGNTREIRDCQIDAAIPRDSADVPLTPDGDWDPTSPQRCDGLVEFSRRRVRKLQSAADEAYAVDRIRCGRDLGCLQQARETAARRQDAIRAEDSRLSGEIQRCEIEISRGNR